MSDSIFNTKKLGFGYMRLPRRSDGSFDTEHCARMVDMFMAAGFNYFDTAYVYTGSEEDLKKTLVDRYPRESYTIASKMCAFMQCDGEESAKRQLYTSLERTGAGYFDYYLLHSLEEDNYMKYDEYHLWDFVKEAKEKGLIRHYGFSFHAGPERLDRLLTEHPDAEFVQLQINYADWESVSIQSGKCYEIARKHGKPIIIMEPVKGGLLADPLPDVKKLLTDHAPDASCASWAVRFAASLEGVAVVLSGMSDTNQMADNISFMEDFTPLTEEEQKILVKARELMEKDELIPCTSCRYCIAGCPMDIQIPVVFSDRNKYTQYGNLKRAVSTYERHTKGHGLASSCIKCMQCENVCPQHLPVTSYLEECAEVFEN